MTGTKTADNRRIAAEVGEIIDAIRSSEGKAREDAISRVVVLLYPHFRNWAPQFCRVSGDISGKYREDVVHVSVERTMTILRELGDPTKHAKVVNWYSYLYGACRYASLNYFHSGEVTVASGMTSALRRQRHLGRIREELRGKLGRDPEDQELIEAANANMRARRSNPEKQGVLVDLSDLQIIAPAADFADHDRAVESHDESGLLAPVEGRLLVEKIVQACHGVAPEYGQVAHLWIGGMYAEPPTIGSTAVIARELSVGIVEAETLLTTVRGIAQDLAKRQFGIAFPG